MSRVRAGRGVALLAVPLFLSGCLMTPNPVLTPKPAESEQEQTMTDTATSRLDEAGLERIYAAKQATFDISDRQLLRTDVGLESTEYVPEIAPEKGKGLITLRLIGPSGTLEARTDRVRFATFQNDPVIDTIYYFLTAHTPEEFFEVLRSGAAAYGFDQEFIEREIEGMIRYPYKKNEFAIDPGYSLGFEVIYDVRYKGPGHVNVVIVTVSPGLSEPQRWE